MTTTEEDAVTTEEEAAPALAVIGARIQEAREAAGMTQEDLADKLTAGPVRVTQGSVSRWEAGERLLEVTDLLRIADALGEPAAALLPDEHQDPIVAAPDGYFAEIAFMGHIEHIGYVTQTIKHGQPAYHIDLPDKVFGGDPLAWVEHAASAWFSERPLTEASVRSAWEAERRRIAERDRQQAEWRRRQERQAITAGGGGNDEYDKGAPF
jgi:transcriptional regulator with XRE-family HTH domain